MTRHAPPSEFTLAVWYRGRAGTGRSSRDGARRGMVLRGRVRTGMHSVKGGMLGACNVQALAQESIRLHNPPHKPSSPARACAPTHMHDRVRACTRTRASTHAHTYVCIVKGSVGRSVAVESTDLEGSAVRMPSSLRCSPSARPSAPSGLAGGPSSPGRDGGRVGRKEGTASNRTSGCVGMLPDCCKPPASLRRASFHAPPATPIKCPTARSKCQLHCDG